MLDMGGNAVETLERVLGGRLEDVGERLRGRTQRRTATAPRVDPALGDVIDAER
jgi:hypothetical protein